MVTIDDNYLNKKFKDDNSITNTNKQVNDKELKQEARRSVTISVKGEGLSNDLYSDQQEIRINCKIMEGETLKDYIKASYRIGDKAFPGLLALTDFRLIFCLSDQSLFDEVKLPSDYFNISLFHIEKVTKAQDRESSNSSFSIDVLMKDTRIIRFYITTKKSKIADSINKACNPKDKNAYFVYSAKYLSLMSKDEHYFDGWELYDPISEFKRQGVTETNDLNLRYCFANKDFKLCQTYPQFLIVHTGISDDELREASEHRTKNRLPVLTYYYGKGEKNAQTKYPSLWRSSQTKSGITGKNKSNKDNYLIETIIGLSSKQLYIFDARPFINALANRVNGGGYENADHYTNVEIIFCDIDNIHAVRNSLNKVNQLCKGAKVMDNQKFWSSLEATNWYFFVHLLLKYSTEITLKLLENCSVLNHCSDGWDRTSQLVSLSQLLIDPFYRTILGFGVLLEKDWLSFGHQFGIRNGIYFKEPKEDQRSPIFLQFLDCVHQIRVQFPNAFEFNDVFLVFLANSFNSNCYGTFMYNSDFERSQMNAKNKTASIWSDVVKCISDYTNPFFQSNPPIEVLKPNYAPCCLTLWTEYFMQYNIDYNPIVVFDNKTNANVSFVSSNEYFDFYFKQKQSQLKKDQEMLEAKYSQLKQFALEIYDKTLNDENNKELNAKAQGIIHQDTFNDKK